MRLTGRLQKWFMRTFPEPQIRGIFMLEDSVAEYEGELASAEHSPERFEIALEMLKLDDDDRALPGFPRSLPRVLSSIRNIKLSLTSLTDNPSDPKIVAPNDFFPELETHARSLGIGSLGCTKVPRQWIFRNKAVLHDNAIVLVMEMDKERMDKAPSPDTGLMVHETYDMLGRAANRLAEYLRGQGYSAHAGHPLGGLALYPALAGLAGLGWRGANGILIAPDFGPRHRLAAVFTSIENLPHSGDNPHEWVADFCAECQICLDRCPVDAILEEPVVHAGGRVSCIDNDKCFPYFAANHGCSICIKVCPFSNRDYNSIREAFQGTA